MSEYVGNILKTIWILSVLIKSLAAITLETLIKGLLGLGQ